MIICTIYSSDDIEHFINKYDVATDKNQVDYISCLYIEKENVKRYQYIWS